jgi:N-acetylmuramoyl-L-alanine amidase
MPKDIQPPFPIEFIQIPNVNYRQREAGVVPDAIAIHIAEGMKPSVVNEFSDPASQKSSHFLVCRDGSVTQFVNTGKVAFCTGNIDNPINELALTRMLNPNSWSFGIEHEGFSSGDITEAQYQATASLCKFLHDKWGVPLDRTHIFGHREVYSLKTCPGKINVDRIVQMARKL